MLATKTPHHFLRLGCRNVLTEEEVNTAFRAATVRFGNNRR